MQVLQPKKQQSSDDTFDLGVSGLSFSLKNKNIESKIGKLNYLRDFLKFFLLSLAMIFRNGKEVFTCVLLL